MKNSKRNPVIATFLISLICMLIGDTQAATLPVSEDSFAFRSKLTTAANKASNLSVDATHTGFIYFNLGDLPESASIRYARLRIYFPKTVRAGSGLAVHTVTGSWDESVASSEPAFSSPVIATFPPEDLQPKHFVSVDITATVQGWLTTPASNEGLAITAVPGLTSALTARVSVGAKEGSGSGYPAELEVELNPAAGSIGSAQLATNLTLSGTTTGTFSGDGSGLTNLSGASLAAGSVGSTQLAANAVTSSNIAAGAVDSAQLAPGAAAANLGASGQAGVVSGGVLLSLTENAALVAAGYVNIGTALLSTGAPGARYSHTAVWTGSEMIVWGGSNNGGNFLNDGARYNPTNNTWTPVTTSGAPSGRYGHTAVWTGSEMIVWGGLYNNSGGYLNDGARYNPANNTWTPVTTSGAPSGRIYHTAVWTGSEMIVWGGFNGSGGGGNDGARYNPVGNTWTQVNTVLMYLYQKL